MGAVIGDLLPLAVGVAVSPVPIMAVILMLLAPRAGGTSTGFLVGWVLGIAVATVVFTLVAGATDLGDPANPSALASWVKLILGALLLLLAVRDLRGKPAADGKPALPRWMSAIEAMTPPRAVGLAFLLAAVNPKNLAMCVAAGVAVAGGSTSGGGTAVAVAVFTALAASTVAVPVLAYAVAAGRMRGPLDRLRTWLERHNSAVMGTLLLVIGVVLAGKGIAGLF
jgi:threonine/homoserine/homoserine lactone efflux protein